MYEDVKKVAFNRDIYVTYNSVVKYVVYTPDDLFRFDTAEEATSFVELTVNSDHALVNLKRELLCLEAQ